MTTTYLSPVGSGLKQGRTDQGVDFTGKGPLYAVGSGKILSVSNAGWPGGTFIALELSNPVDLLHSVVYYAEDITPAVQAGQTVKAGDVIGTATGGSSGIEIGWANPNTFVPTGETLAKVTTGYTEGQVTTAGTDFLSFIKGLGTSSQQVPPTPFIPPTGGVAGSSANPQLPAPSNAIEWAYAILLELGINPATNLNSLANLTAQINFEQGGNTVHGNNPLGSKLVVNGSGSAGQVQNYKSWLDGLQGQVNVLTQKNMSSIYTALQNNVSLADYVTALGNGQWEGSDKGTNVTYGNNVAARFAAMTKGQSGGWPQLSAAYLNFPSGGQTAVQGQGGTPSVFGEAAGIAGLGISAIPGLGTVYSFVQDLVNGFGIGWKGVLGIIIGVLLIGAGLLIMFHHQTQEVISSATGRVGLPA